MKKCLLFFVLLVSSVYGQTIAELKKEIAEAKEPKDKIAPYTDLGIIYFNESNFVEALNNFTKSMKIAESVDSKFQIGSNCNNISATYYEVGKYEEAVKYAKKAISIFEQLDDYNGLANAYNSLGLGYYMMKINDKCEEAFIKSIEYEIKKKDSLGINIGYKNLGAFYFELGDTLKGIESVEKGVKFLPTDSDVRSKYKSYLTLAEVYCYSHDLINAKRYIDSCSNYIYELEKDKFYHHVDDYYYVLYSFYSQKGDFQQALENFKHYSQIKDSVLNIESNEQLLEIKTKYETEKKEQELKEEKLKSAQEKQKFNLYITILIIALLGLIFLVMFLRNRHKHKTEILLRERNELVLSKVLETEEKERTRIAKDLHDGIVQDLVAIKHQLNKTVDLEPNESKENVKSIALDIERAGNELRDISYQMMPLTLKEYGLEKALDSLLQKTCGALNISYDFELINVHQKLEEKIEVSIYRICQELINNSVKHSQASQIGLLIQGKGDHLQIIYEDNGVGFDADSITKGIGLNSLDSRIELIKGSFTIDSEISKGVTAYIRIPL